MRKKVVAILSAIIVGLMLVPSGATAGSKTVYTTDSTGDLGFGFSSKTGEILKAPWGLGTPWVVEGYFDIASTWLSQKGQTYTFGMELATELPKEGTALPGSIKRAEWAMWIDPSPWNMATNPVASLLKVALIYDDLVYSAELRDATTGAYLSSLPFAVDGSTFEVEFSATSIGNLEIHWWCPITRVWQGLFGSWGLAYLDGIDWGTAAGQEYYDLPWPPV
jgi:hypothetical protein